MIMDLLDSYSSDETDETKHEAVKSRKIPSDLLLFQPVSGDYPSLVYIEAPESALLFSRLFRALASCDEIRSLSLAPLFTEKNNQHTLLQPVPRDVPLHLSLSRVFTLRQNQIAPFIKHVTSFLRDIKVRSLDLQLVSCPTLFVNEVKTRGYFGLSLDSSSIAFVDTLVSSVDLAMTAFGKPVYYKPSHHHVSFAVIEGDGDELVNTAEANGVEAAAHVFDEQQEGGFQGGGGGGEALIDEGKVSVERHLLSTSTSLSSSSSLLSDSVATKTTKRRKIETDIAPTRGKVDKSLSSVLSNELSSLFSDKSLSISWKVAHILVKIGHTTHKIPVEI